MALDVDVSSDREQDIFPNFGDLEDTVNHILYNVVQEGKGKTVEALSMEFERDLLVETRDNLFQHAMKRYREQLREVGIQETPDLYVKRRTGEKAANALAGDIVDLYLYAGRFIDVFPKSILGNVGKLVEFKRPTLQKKVDELDTQRRLAEIAGKVNEQADRVKDLEKNMETMKQDYEAKIKNLETELSKAKKVLCDIKDMCIARPKGSAEPCDKAVQVIVNGHGESTMTGEKITPVGEPQNSAHEANKAGRQLVVDLPDRPVSE